MEKIKKIYTSRVNGIIYNYRLKREIKRYKQKRLAIENNRLWPNWRNKRDFLEYIRCRRTEQMDWKNYNNL